MYIAVHVQYPLQYPLFFSHFSETRIFSTDFRKTPVSNYKEIHPVGAELFHSDGQTDRHDELTVAFRNFAKSA
jgi:hypothetical protein